jgi:hypothetical protein
MATCPPSFKKELENFLNDIELGINNIIATHKDEKTIMRLKKISDKLY